MNLDLGQIAVWIGATLVGGSAERDEQVSGYSIDSRTLEAGDLFFAVSGDRLDGHDYIGAAFERGAGSAVIARSRAEEFRLLVSKDSFLLVDDPLVALQSLAAAVRKHWGGRVIGITGSAGKTTTKDAIAEVLDSRFKVLKSQGNLNNHFGLPLQLLRLERGDEVAVIEMGMSHAGEIAALAKIAAPDWGVVTNVGSAHAQNFAEGIEGIARAKSELIQALPQDGIAFLNCDDVYVSRFGGNYRGKSVYFGSGSGCNPRVLSIEEVGGSRLQFLVSIGAETALVRLALMGRHNVSNALAAIAVGVESGISLEDCARSLADLKPGEKRGETIEFRGARIINDCYNSNPEALKSMIGALAAMPAERRILVAGEMLELGEDAPEMHRACGRAAGLAGLDAVIGVRGNAQYIVEGARQAGAKSRFLESAAEAGAWLRAEVKQGDVVLLKASRGVRLEQALEILFAEKAGSGEMSTEKKIPSGTPRL